MKISRLSIVAVILIIIVVITAGCSSKPKVGSTVSSSSVFSNDYKWIEYQISGSLLSEDGNNMTLKVEKSTEDYQGSPAVHVKMTLQVGSGTDSGTIVSDIYYDKLMKNALGGTRTMSDLYGHNTTETLSGYELSGATDTMDLFNKNTILTYEGTESVTVPLGTYSDADLYTNSTNGVTSSYWVTSNIPVPLKVQDSTSSMSLVGWG